jgi:hypothetical protein
VQTAEGELSVEIPQVREAADQFVSKLFPRETKLLRTEPLKAMVIGAFVRGLSMRDVESLCEQAGLAKLSKPTAARMCAELSCASAFEPFQSRDVYDIHLAALFLDATFSPSAPDGPEQSGERSRTGALSKAGSRTLRWAAVEAAHHAWPPTNPWHELYTHLAAHHGQNPAKSAVARKVPIASWHVLSRNQPFNPSRPGGTVLPRHAPAAFCRPMVPHGIEKPRQLRRTLCAASAEREMSPRRPTTPDRPPKP